MCRIMQIEEDVIHRDLHNPSHRTTAEFNSFIIHSKYFSVLTCLPPRRPSSKLWPISRHGFRI